MIDNIGYDLSTKDAAAPKSTYHSIRHCFFNSPITLTRTPNYYYIIPEEILEHINLSLKTTPILHK